MCGQTAMHICHGFIVASAAYDSPYTAVKEQATYILISHRTR